MFSNNPFDSEIIPDLLLTLFIVVASFVIITVVRRLISRYINRPERSYNLSKLTGRIVGFMGIVLIIAIWSPDVNNIVTILTLIGAGLAIALREMVLSVVGWLHILVGSPFETGDRIEVNGVHGDVVDIRMLHTTLMETQGWVEADQSTGRLVHIPNNWIFTHGIYNYTTGFSFIWNEIDVTLTYGSDWEKAREVMTAFAKESSDIVAHQARKELRSMARRYLVHYSILTPFVYVHMTHSGIKLTLRYLCEARKRRGTEHALTVSILRAFEEDETVQFAHDTLSNERVKPNQTTPAPPMQLKEDE